MEQRWFGMSDFTDDAERDYGDAIAEDKIILSRASSLLDQDNSQTEMAKDLIQKLKPALTELRDSSVDNQIQEILAHLMDYSFDYGKGIIPSSENPPLLIARKATKDILALFQSETDKARVDEIRHSPSYGTERELAAYKTNRLRQLNPIKKEG